MRFSAQPRTAEGRRLARPAGRGAADSAPCRQPAFPIQRRSNAPKRTYFSLKENSSFQSAGREQLILRPQRHRTRDKGRGDFIRPREQLDFLLTNPGLKRTLTLM